MRYKIIGETGEALGILNTIEIVKKVLVAFPDWDYVELTKERRAGSKLSDKQVDEICLRRANGDKLQLLSKEYGVSMAYISKICKQRE